MRKKIYMKKQRKHLCSVLGMLLCFVVMAFCAGCDNPYKPAIRETNGTIQLSKTGADDGGAGIAWPEPRFVDNGDGTVTDKLTGLMWGKEPSSNKMAWADAFTYVKALTTGGHTDWTLPNRTELNSLCDYSKYGPVLPDGHPFSNIGTSPEGAFGQGNLFSSTTVAETTMVYAGVYDLDAYYGYSEWNGKGNHVVLPVRHVGGGTIKLPQTGQTTCYDAKGVIKDCTGTGQDGELKRGAAWPSTRFTDNGDKTMLDNLTGLIWPIDAGAGGKMTWAKAKKHVARLNMRRYLGKKDWRLPNINEINSLVNVGQINSLTWLTDHGFANVQPEFYWSATPCAFDSNQSWVSKLRWGVVFNGTVDTEYWVWPVR